MLSPVHRLIFFASVSIGAIVAQDGAAPFGVAQHVVGRFDQIQAVVDLDLDGAPDYVAVTFGTNGSRTWSWRRNRGDGLVDGSAALPSLSQLQRFFVLDLDGDGNDDLGIYGGGSLIRFLAAPGGPRAMPAEAFPDFAGAVQLADMDGDGDLDVVGADPSRHTSSQLIAVDVGLQGFTPIFGSAFLNSYEFFVADYDGDGSGEMWTFNDSWIWVRGHDGMGGSTLLSTAANPFGLELNPVVGDVDGDGDVDVAFFQEYLRQFVIARNHGGGSWVMEAITDGGPSTDFGDLDGDGDLDGLCCGGGVGPHPNQRASDFEISLNDGTGHFDPAFKVMGIGADHLIAARDMDGDGDMDLVAGRVVVFSPGSVERLRSRQGWHASIQANLFDVDGDGDVDQALGGTGSSFVYGRNDGSGNVRQHTVYSGVAGSGQAIGTADFDGDGDPDVLVEFGSGATAQLRLYRNTGGHLRIPIDAAASGLSMRPTSSYSPGNSVRPVNQWSFPVDWDGDGDVDMAVMDESAAWSKLFANDGRGQFTLALTLQNSMVLGAADFDGNGLPDLIATAPGTTVDVSIRFQQSVGAFGPPLLLAGSARDARPGIVDVDGDGDLDLFSSTSSGVGLYRNQGGGSMVLEPLGSAILRGNLVWSAGDIDEDGGVDAVGWAIYHDANRTSILLMSDGSGGYRAPVSVIGSIGALADMDADGDLDGVASGHVYPSAASTRRVGTWRQYGAGVRGKGGVVPTIGEVGLVEVNRTATIRVSGVRGGAAGLFLLGLQEGNLPVSTLPGLTLWVDQFFEPLPIVADGAVDAAGVGTWSLPWRVPPGLGGVELYTQAFFFDDRSPASGMSQTNGKVTILPY